MSKLPCEVVKDLFPSYIDELTGEVTNQLIEEHTKECENCRQTLASMKEPEPESTEQPQKKEIDYLKKTRKKNRKNIMIAVIVVLALVLGGFGVKHFFVGTTMQYEYLECQVKVDGKWYNVDTTWDDPIYFLNGVRVPYLSYDYFLVSDDVLYQDHSTDSAQHICTESYPKP